MTRVNIFSNIQITWLNMVTCKSQMRFHREIRVLIALLNCDWLVWCKRCEITIHIKRGESPIIYNYSMFRILLLKKKERKVPSILQVGINGSYLIIPIFITIQIFNCFQIKIRKIYRFKNLSSSYERNLKNFFNYSQKKRIKKSLKC